MLGRLTRILLLACFAFWASGAALYAHERLEHGTPDADDAAAAGLVAGAFGAPAGADVAGARRSGDEPSGAHHQHDHDKCPVCQALASMKAERACAPVLLESHRPLFRAAIVPGRRPPVVFSLPAAPIRGPPLG